MIELSNLLRKEIIIDYSRRVLRPSGIRRSGMGVSLLSPLRPVLGNGNGEQLIELLRYALTFDHVLKRVAPRHLWAIDRPKVRYPTCQ